MPPDARAERVAGVQPASVLVASGKGGVGTSCIAALLAIAAAERGERVLLVDAVEASGTLHHLFGARPTQSLWMLGDTRLQPENGLIDVGENLTLMPGGSSADALTPPDDHYRRTALGRLALLYPAYSLVVFDGGSRLDTITAVGDLAEPAMLLVTSADRLALAANYALVKSVHLRRPAAIMSVLSNRHGEAVAQEACGFLVSACTHFLKRAIDVAGAVPDDPCLQAAVGAGMSVRDALDGSPAMDAVRAMLPRFIPTWPAAPQRSGPAPLLPSASPSFPRRWS